MQEELKPKLSGMPGQAIIESADYFVSGLIEERNTIFYLG
jgi:hypothetical protein